MKEPKEKEQTDNGGANAEFHREMERNEMSPLGIARTEAKFYSDVASNPQRGWVVIVCWLFIFLPTAAIVVAGLYYMRSEGILVWLLGFLAAVPVMIMGVSFSVATYKFLIRKK